MDHYYIEEHGIVARYLLGRLPVEERVRFEEHYADCDVCLDQLDLGDDCLQVLQNAAAGNMAPAGVHFPAKLFLRFTRLKPRWQTALICGVIFFLALLPPLVLEIGRLRQELNRLKAVAAGKLAPSPVSIGQEPLPVRTGEPKFPATAPRPVDPHPQPTSQPPQQARVRRNDKSNLSLQPQTNILISELTAVRGAGSSQAELINQIEAPDPSQWIIFYFELEGDPEYKTYRATFLTADGRRVWRKGQLRPNHDGGFTIGFPNASLRDGDYMLALDGLTPERRYVAVAIYPLRVIKKKFLK